jgi:hypothetical protein
MSVLKIKANGVWVVPSMDGHTHTVEDIIDFPGNLPADVEHNHDDRYYTKAEIDSMDLITVEDIDEICGDLDPSVTLMNFSVTDDGEGNVVISTEGA